jgi:serine protease Do
MTRWDGPALGLRGVVGVLLAAASAGGAGPEVISLKDGHQVVGEVVAEKAGALYVDLGFDVLKVPRDQVVGRAAARPGAAGSAAALGLIHI